MDNNFDVDDGMAVAKKPLPPAALKQLKAAISDAGGQAAVAHAAGVSQSQVSRMCNGQDVKLSTALAILRAIGGGITHGRQEAVTSNESLDYRTRCIQLEEELIAVKRALLAQQTAIMDAVKAACCAAGLTADQVEAMTRAVVHYDAQPNAGACESHQSAVGD